MRILFDTSSRLESLQQSLHRLDEDANVSAILTLLPSGNDHPASALTPLLQATRKPLFGGIFPAIIHNNQIHHQGHLLLGLPTPVQYCLVDPLDDLTGQVLRTLDITHQGTLFILVDGMASAIGALMEQIYDTFALDVHYLGGGCGSWDLNNRDCILSNQGVSRNAALLCFAEDIQSHIGVAHGWQALSEPIKVTESLGGRLITLDWKPAREVYCQHLFEYTGTRINEDNFPLLAPSYPFGIARLDAEMVIRDPTALDGNDILCLGDIPAGSYVHIMHGEEQQLFKAAAEAQKRAQATTGDNPGQCQLIMDCISRALLLGDRFEHELQAFAQPGLPMLGALTIGEIANHGDDYLEFYNKTAVVGILE